MFLTCWAHPFLDAADKNAVIVFNHDFEKNQSLAGWTNVLGHDLGAIEADKQAHRVAEENGNHFFRCTGRAGIFGVTAPLKEPLTISANVARVELKARMRKYANTAWTIQIALTSRTKPEGQQGQGFQWSGAPADSGFRVCGYQYGNEANFLEWRVDGLSHSHTEKRNFLLNGNDDWHEWRVVFDQAAGTLALYTEVDGEDPVLVQKGVALDGVELHSVWLNGSGGGKDAPDLFLDYDDIVVSYTPAGK
ncbi:MAG: hypothetical protein HY360_06075 [Verrucomicrobia bacterium]|nr:hypothetical protein [Verrucomicrobiota bacterium]